jgi:hypothetical protein
VDVAAASPEQFLLLRGSPVLIGVSCSVATGFAVYTLAVSAAGATVATAIVTSTVPASSPLLAVIKPTQVLYSSEDASLVAPMLWYGGRVDDSTATNAADLATSLHTLNFLSAT